MSTPIYPTCYFVVSHASDTLTSHTVQRWGIANKNFFTLNSHLGTIMNAKYPDTIPINHDNYSAKYIGATSDGNQFFLTTPFVPAKERGYDDEGCEFIALYQFDADGKLISFDIENLGPREKLDENLAQEKFQSLLNSLGEVEYGNIFIQAFQVVKFGVIFGLIPINPRYAEDEDDLCLEVHPGNYMAFSPPWDGNYDT